MPISDRILKIFYRKIIARECRKLGYVITNSKTSLSFRPGNLSRDILVSFLTLLKRIGSRVFTGKMYSPDVERVSADTNERLLKNTAFLHDVCAMLQEKHVLLKNIDFSMMNIEQIDIWLFGFGLQTLHIKGKCSRL